MTGTTFNATFKVQYVSRREQPFLRLSSCFITALIFLLKQGLL